MGTWGFRTDSTYFIRRFTVTGTIHRISLISWKLKNLIISDHILSLKKFPKILSNANQNDMHLSF